MGRLRSMLVLLGLAVGCEEREAMELDNLGDPCRSAYDECLGEDSVLTCEAGILVERECSSVCAELGPAYLADGCDRECVCVLADPSGCTPGVAACIDPDTVGVCDDEQTMQSTPCMEVCLDAGLTPLGCMQDEDALSSCWCTAEGTACADAVPQCVDELTIAMCEAGVWSFFECGDVCGAPASCDPLQSPAVCGCV